MEPSAQLSRCHPSRGTRAAASPARIPPAARGMTSLQAVAMTYGMPASSSRARSFGRPGRLANAAVYSSFLLHAERAAIRYGVLAHEILQRVGEAGYVGGQEDMIIDVALQLVAQKERAAG